MRAVCKGGEIDFDKLNKFDPDGHGPFCAVSVDGYGTDVPAAEKGTFLLTSDNGRVRCADLAFKMALDMGLRAGAPSLGYLAREVARSCAMYSDGERSLARVPDGGTLGPYLSEIGVRSVLLPGAELCVAHNFGALREHDMAAWMAARGAAATAVVKFLNSYLWLGRGARTFSGLCGAMADLLTAMSTDDARIFIEGFYGALDGEYPDEPAEHEPRDGAGEEGGEPGEGMGGPGTRTSGMAPAVPVLSLDPVEERPADGVVEAFINGAIRVKGLSSRDITGLDETYSLNYFEEGYLRELNMKDSEGLFDGVLKARINGTPAPVDVLSEVVGKEAAGRGEAAQLKSKLADIAEEISERAGDT